MFPTASADQLDNTIHYLPLKIFFPNEFTYLVKTFLILRHQKYSILLNTNLSISQHWKSKGWGDIEASFKVHKWHTWLWVTTVSWLRCVQKSVISYSRGQGGEPGYSPLGPALVFLKVLWTKKTVFFSCLGFQVIWTLFFGSEPSKNTRARCWGNILLSLPALMTHKSGFKRV